MKPHKWAKEIHAWADGAAIEGKDIYTGEWVEIEPYWETDDEYEYRIKPQPKEPHEVSEQYGKAMQQAYEDGFVQGKIYQQNGRVSDGKTIPKEPQYLCVVRLTNGNIKLGIYGEFMQFEKGESVDKVIGKIKLETDDD